MSDDERFVRSVWKVMRNDGTRKHPIPVINGKVLDVPFAEWDAGWSAARQWTEAKIKEVEDVREEIVEIEDDYATWGVEPQDEQDKRLEAVYGRILTRLRAEQSRLVANMRPEFVAERGWNQ